MRYIVAFIIPPLAIAMCGRWVHFIVNLVMWLVSLPLIFFLGIGLIGWLICTAYALVVCRMSSVDKRLNKLVSAIQESRQSGEPTTK